MVSKINKITEKVKKIAEKVEIEWEKKWAQRGVVSNIAISVPKVVIGTVSFIISPFSEINRQITQEINRDSTIHITGLMTPLYSEGKECIIPSEVELKNAKINITDGKCHYISNGKSYSLSPILNQHKEVIINEKDGSCLYGFTGDKKQPVVWIIDGKTLVKENYGDGTVIRTTSVAIKAIAIVPYDEKNGQKHILLPIVWPASLVSILLKQFAALSKTIIYVPGNALCKVQNKFLSELVLTSTIKDSNSIEYLEGGGGTVFSSVKLILATICGVIGNTFKLVGTITNETLRCVSAIISIPSALCGPTYKEVKKQHLIVASKSFVVNIKSVVSDLINSFKRLESTDDLHIAKDRIIVSPGTVSYGVSVESINHNKKNTIDESIVLKPAVNALASNLKGINSDQCSYSEDAITMLRDEYTTISSRSI